MWLSYRYMSQDMALCLWTFREDWWEGTQTVQVALPDMRQACFNRREKRLPVRAHTLFSTAGSAEAARRKRYPLGPLLQYGTDKFCKLRNIFFPSRTMMKKANKRQEIKIYANTRVPRATITELYCTYRRRHKS